MFVVCDLARLAAAHRRYIDLSHAAISGLVHIRNRIGEEIAFRRDLWITHAADFQKIFDCKATFLGSDNRAERKHKNGKRDSETLHKSSFVGPKFCLGKPGYYRTKHHWRARLTW